MKTNSSNSLYKIIDEAIDFLRINLSTNENIFVGFSGGKDSICTAKLIEMSGLNYQLYCSHTGLDAPEVIRFIRKNYPECIFLKPLRSFWKNLSTNVGLSHLLHKTKFNVI